MNISLVFKIYRNKYKAYVNNIIHAFKENVAIKVHCIEKIYTKYLRSYCIIIIMVIIMLCQKSVTSTKKLPLSMRNKLDGNNKKIRTRANKATSI